MSIQARVFPYTLDFKFPAGTSRGVLKEKRTYFIKAWDKKHPETVGWGECGPLSKLSIDDDDNLLDKINAILPQLSNEDLPKTDEGIYELALKVVGHPLPALRFGLETALLDLKNGGHQKLFENDFYNKSKKIPINGLIWMSHMEGMLLQISDKINEGFDCVKMKVGSMDFEKEIDILHYIRRKYYSKEIMVRVDANGAFKPHEARYKMEAMARHDIHSIEQPIMAGLHTEMAELCVNPPIDIALDEDLIGVNTLNEKKALLVKIKPQYIIIKPTLIGGIQSSLEWIKLANELNIGWWITSALESNVGLNAICQLAKHTNAKSYQGLGTGKLYHNNIDSPLTIEKGHIYYNKDKEWNLNSIENDSTDRG